MGNCWATHRPTSVYFLTTYVGKISAGSSTVHLIIVLRHHLLAPLCILHWPNRRPRRVKAPPHHLSHGCYKVLSWIYRRGHCSELLEEADVAIDRLLGCDTTSWPSDLVLDRFSAQATNPTAEIPLAHLLYVLERALLSQATTLAPDIFRFNLLWFLGKRRLRVNVIFGKELHIRRETQAREVRKTDKGEVIKVTALSPTRRRWTPALCFASLLLGGGQRPVSLEVDSFALYNPLALSSGAIFSFNGALLSSLSLPLCRLLLLRIAQGFYFWKENDSW